MIASIPTYLPPNSPFLCLYGRSSLYLFTEHDLSVAPSLLIRPSCVLLCLSYNVEEKSPAEALRRAKEKGSERGKSIVNGEKVSRKLELAAERNYQRMMDLWHECATLRFREDVR